MAGLVKIGDLDIPTARCPHCKREEFDFDGTGILAHTWPDYDQGCGWCSHPTGAGGQCEICDSPMDAEAGVLAHLAAPSPSVDDLFDPGVD